MFKLCERLIIVFIINFVFVFVIIFNISDLLIFIIFSGIFLRLIKFELFILKLFNDIFIFKDLIL